MSNESMNDIPPKGVEPEFTEAIINAKNVFIGPFRFDQ